MRSLCTILSLCLAISLCNSQDWQPFVFGKKYFYGQVAEDGLKIHWFELDSSLYANDGYRYLHPVPCVFWSFLEFVDAYPELNGYLELKRPLFFKEEENRIYYYSLKYEEDEFVEFEFRPNARPGDTWDSDFGTMACVEERDTLILGEPDSVRIFQCQTEPFESMKFYLSKSNGLISFPPFQNFEMLNPEEFELNYNLIGLHDSISQIGYRQPHFQEYFDLCPGDILYWEHGSIQYLPEMRRDTAFFIDTIITVIKMPDTIKYVKHRDKFNARGEYVSSQYAIDFFLKGREGKVLEGQPGWFTEPDLNFGFDPYYGLRPLQLNISGNDTITHTCLQSAFNEIDDFDCTIHPYFDNYDNLCYRTGVGLTYSFFGGLGGDNWTVLIGSVIDGIAQGTIEIPTYTYDLTKGNIGLFPNPSGGLIHFPDPGIRYDFAELYNLSGSLEFIRENVSGSLDITPLQPGIYLLHLFDNSGSHMITRIVKQ